MYENNIFKFLNDASITQELSALTCIHADCVPLFCEFYCQKIVFLWTLIKNFYDII